MAPGIGRFFRLGNCCQSALGEEFVFFTVPPPTLAVYEMPHFSPALPTLDIIFFFHFCQFDRQNVSYSNLCYLNSEVEPLCIFSVCMAVNTYIRVSKVVQWYRICLPMQETWVPSLGQEDSLGKEMATHSSILA